MIELDELSCVESVAKEAAQHITGDTRLSECYSILEQHLCELDMYIAEESRPEAYIKYLRIIGDELAKKDLRKFW